MVWCRNQGIFDFLKTCPYLSLTILHQVFPNVFGAFRARRFRRRLGAGPSSTPSASTWSVPVQSLVAAVAEGDALSSSMAAVSCTDSVHRALGPAQARSSRRTPEAVGAVGAVVFWKSWVREMFSDECFLRTSFWTNLFWGTGFVV